MTTRTKTVLNVCVFVLCLLALGFGIRVWVQRGPAGRGGLGRSFAFDMDRHLVTDPALILYRESAPIAVDLPDPSCMATGPGGLIYVGGEDSVLVLSDRGEERGRIPVGVKPACLAVDGAGRVLCGTGARVIVFDSAGERVDEWPAESEDAQIASVAAIGSDVFAGDATRGEVLRLNASGDVVETYTDFVVFSSPSIGMDGDAEGNLWVADPGRRGIRRYSQDGELTMEWKRPGRGMDGFSGCCNPVDLAVRGDGALVTSEKNIVRVKVVTPEGELIGVVAGPESFDQSIGKLDVDVDSNGRVLVLDPVRREVRVFEEIPE